MPPCTYANNQVRDKQPVAHSVLSARVVWVSDIICYSSHYFPQRTFSSAKCNSSQVSCLRNNPSHTYSHTSACVKGACDLSSRHYTTQHAKAHLLLCIFAFLTLMYSRPLLQETHRRCSKLGRWRGAYANKRTLFIRAHLLAFILSLT